MSLFIPTSHTLGIVVEYVVQVLQITDGHRVFVPALFCVCCIGVQCNSVSGININCTLYIIITSLLLYTILPTGLKAATLDLQNEKEVRACHLHHSERDILCLRHVLCFFLSACLGTQLSCITIDKHNYYNKHIQSYTFSTCMYHGYLTLFTGAGGTAG